MPIIEHKAMRLNKFLSAAGLCSRRKADEWITKGMITVNGKPADELGTKIDPAVDHVRFQGKTVRMDQPGIYIALHKPKGFVTSCSQKNDQTVLDLIDVPQRVYPVGRLDKESTGLLLLTNDGRIHHGLSHPSFNHEKEYIVTVTRPITDSVLKKFEKGLPMMGTKTRAAVIRRLSSRRFSIVLKEGKNRQIRRMVRKVGYRVHTLKRIRIAHIHLGTLALGKWRYLTNAEKKQLITSDP
jgi:23S rRNA pseudouridine2605 synthase/23S rRNA pseudouridine2604 synthase